MDDLELKRLIEDGNKTIEALRGEVEAKKKADVVTEEKIGRMEANLSAILAEKAAEQTARKAAEDRLRELETKMNRPGNRGFGPGEDEGSREHKAAFFEWMRRGDIGGAAQKLFDLQTKATDTQVATAASGGYALPKQLSDGLTQLILDISPIRQLATVVTVSTPDYHDLIDINGFQTEWLGETSTHNQTNTPSLAEVVPTFGEISAKPQATRQAITDLNFDVEGWLRQRGAQAFAVAEGLAFISGNGTNRPTGFLSGPTPVSTADSSRAFGTLQYVASGQAAALATNPFDTFQQIPYQMRAGYRQGAVWVMNSITQGQLATVKDSTGQYLMQPSISMDQPDRIGGYAVVVAEDMPTIAANAFPVAFGNFKAGYLIADVANSFWMQRDEITQPGYIKFPMSRRVGGKIRDSQAIKLLKIAVS